MQIHIRSSISFVNDAAVNFYFALNFKATEHAVPFVYPHKGGEQRNAIIVRRVIVNQSSPG